MDQALFSYAIPGITNEFNIGLERIGQLLSLSFFVASFAVVIAGVVSDYIGRRQMFGLLLASSALFIGLHALSTTIGWLALYRVVGFALAAALFPVTATIVAEVSPARYRGMLMGWFNLSYPIGFAIGAWIAATLLDDFGWRATFYPAFLVIPLAIILGIRLKETDRFTRLANLTAETQIEIANTKTERRSLRLHLGELFSPQYLRRTLLCFFSALCANFAIQVTTYFLPTYLNQAKGITQANAASLLVWSWVIVAIGYALVSYLGEFVFSRRNTVIGWQWLGAASFTATFWLADTEMALMVGLGLSAMFAFGSEIVRIALGAELFPTRMRATAVACTGSLAVTLAALIAPLLVTYSIPIVGWTWTLTVLVAGPLACAGVILTRLEKYTSGLEMEELSA